MTKARKVALVRVSEAHLLAALQLPEDAALHDVLAQPTEDGVWLLKIEHVGFDPVIQGNVMPCVTPIYRQGRFIGWQK